MSPPGAHMTPEELERYCSGDAPGDLIRRVENHIQDCSECARAIVAIVRRQALKKRSEAG